MSRRIKFGRSSRWVQGSRKSSGSYRRAWSVMLVMLVVVSQMAWVAWNTQKAQARVAQNDGLLMYGESGTSTPKFRKWYAGVWGAETAAATIASGTVKHSTMVGAPTRVEAIAGVQMSAGNLYIQRWSAGAWTNEWDVASTDGNLPRYDIAYEQTSGDAIVVYSTNATSNEMAYRIWNGTSWTSAVNIESVRTTGIIHGIILESRTSSDQIGIAYGDANNDLSANLWDGSAWGTEPTAALATVLAEDDSVTVLTHKSFDLAFESTSGDLMVAWGIDATVDPSYSIRASGSGVWAATAVATPLFEEPLDIDLSPDPGSDNIAYVNTTNLGGDADTAIWDGSAWGNAVNFDVSNNATSVSTISNAINWVTSGAQTRAVLTYDDSGTAGFDYKVFNKNTVTWSANVSACSVTPDSVGTDDKLHRLKRNPFNGSELTFILVDANSDLFTKKFTFDGSTTTSGCVTTLGVTLADTNAGGAVVENSVSSITGYVADFAYYKFITNPTYNQAAYRWYKNNDAADLTTMITNPTSEEDILNDSAVDSTSTFIYAVGRQNTTTDGTWRLTKYSMTDMSLSYTQTSNPQASGSDSAAAVAIDNTGGFVYVSGYDTTNTNRGWRTEKRAVSDGSLSTTYSSNPTANNTTKSSIRQLIARVNICI